MDIVNKINKLISDQMDSGATTTDNVAINTAKGHIDVIGGQCPKGQRYDKNKKVCVPVTNEDARNPKKGDRFEYKGRKLTVKSVGTGFVPNANSNRFGGVGLGNYIDVQFDDEKHPRSISIKNFFKGNNFKYLKETSVVGGSYVSGTTTNIIGSGQTRVWGIKRGLMPDLDRKNKVQVISPDATIENLGRRGLKFNHILGAYTPEQWEDTEV
jgi:hypothetical protein